MSISSFISLKTSLKISKSKSSKSLKNQFHFLFASQISRLDLCILFKIQISYKSV